MDTHRLSSPLTLQLDREWRRLGRRRSTIVAVADWRSGDGDLDERARSSLTGVDDLDALLDRTHHRRGEPADVLLLWLLRVGATEPLARRIVLQRCMPLTISSAASWRRSDDRRAVTDEAIASLSAVIASAQLPATARHVAPRLATQAIYEAFRRQSRRRRCHEVVFDPVTMRERPAPIHDIEPIVLTARLLAAATDAGLPEHVVDLAQRLARGESTTQIARVRQCTARTIRNQRERAVRDLRTLVVRQGIDDCDPDSLLAPALTGRLAY